MSAYFVTGGAKPTKIGDEKKLGSMAVSAKMLRLQPWFSVLPFRLLNLALGNRTPDTDVVAIAVRDARIVK